MTLPSQLFLGWCGPRGLASILFVLLILEESAILHREEIRSITVLTVAMSMLLHGMSAAPLSKAYGRLVARTGECAETRPVVEMLLRAGHVREESG